MSWPNPSRHPKFLAIKDKYRKLKQPHKDEIARIADQKERLWTESAPCRALNKCRWIVDNGFDIAFEPDLLKLYFFVALPLGLLFGLESLLKFIAVLWVTWVVLIGVFLVVENRVRALVLYWNKELVAGLHVRAREATARLNVVRREYDWEWTKSCEDHVGRPPDWPDRRAQVLARDGYKCTKCGYPEGFKRKSRELHVHHVVHISDGGDNSMANLVTLCHICHRNIDKHHGAVRKMSKSSKNKRW